MKSLFPNLFDGLLYAFGVVSTSGSAFFNQRSLVNEDFIDQFENESDRKLLDETVSKLKSSNIKSEEITLSNSKRVTIVVD